MDVTQQHLKHMYKYVQEIQKKKSRLFQRGVNEKKLYFVFETKKYKKWSVIIGPEGGFSEKERRTISSLSSCISVSLGKRILRSDTATTSAIFSIQSVIE